MNITSVDLFAGGGGASEGIRMATGCCPIVAVNHCEAAIRMHAANHPRTDHHCASVYRVHPQQVVGRKRVDLLWASPDCRHFSRAKGGKPRNQKIRGLAWVILEWVAAVRPRVVCVENVPEFTTWGPLREDGSPDRARAGETFRQWVTALELYGYQVEWRTLVAADYGSPTTRERLFIVARCDGESIRWPEPTHGEGAARPWRSAASCVDWSVPMCSVFATREEAKDWRRHHGRPGTPRRPMAAATLRRVTEGLRRYVLESEEPYLVMRGNALEAAALQQSGWGERKGQTPRVLDLGAPLGTIMAGGCKHALMAAALQTYYSRDNTSSDVRDPCPTVTTANRVTVAGTYLSTYYGRSASGQEVARPAPTITARPHHAVVAAYLEKFYGSARAGVPVTDPMPTITAGGGGGQHVGLVSAWVSRHYGGGPNGKPAPGIDPRGPVGAVTARDSQGLTQAHLGEASNSRPRGDGGAVDHRSDVAKLVLEHHAGTPLARRVERDGCVTVTLAGVPLVVTDLSLRLFEPRELARAQGFPDSYVLTGNRAEQIARIGNSVPPQVVEAVVRAQFGLGVGVLAA